MSRKPTNDKERMILLNFSIDPPPQQSGDLEADVKAIRDYLEYMIEELEYIFSEVNYGR